MANARVRLDSAGMAELLTSSGVESLVDGLASDVAATIGTFYTTTDNHLIPVQSGLIPGRTRRAGAAVTLAHPAGLAVEGKYGVLANACAANGLEFNGAS